MTNCKNRSLLVPPHFLKCLGSPFWNHVSKTDHCHEWQTLPSPLPSVPQKHKCSHFMPACLPQAFSKTSCKLTVKSRQWGTIMKLAWSRPKMLCQSQTGTESNREQSRMEWTSAGRLPSTRLMSGLFSFPAYKHWHGMHVPSPRALTPISHYF